LVPNVATFNTLINQLLYEGDIKAAQHVVDVEMPAEGVEPDEKTKATMAQADQLISQKNTNQMMELIRTNKYDDAKQYFQMLQKSGQANVIHYNIAITYLCSTSNEQRELISKMKTEGLVPNVVTFTTLIKQLLYEGDIKAAQHVVDVEMPAEGVEPNEKTKATMAQANQLISQKHTNQMMELIRINKYDDAKQYFQMLQKNGQADVFHYNIAITYLCSTSNEKRELISKMKTE
jgi:ribosomal protein L22